MTATTGTVRWATGTADTHLAPLLAAECRTLSTLLGEAQKRRDTEAFDAFLATYTWED